MSSNTNNTIYIKKSNTQDSTDASLNNVLYPSKSHIAISSIKISEGVRYNTTDNTQNYYPNYFQYS